MKLWLNPDGVYLGCRYVQSYDIFFTYRSVTFPVRLSITRGSFLVYFTLSTFYALRGGLGASHGGGFVDGFTLDLVDVVDAGGQV